MTRHHPDFDYGPYKGEVIEQPEITDKARRIIRNAMAACRHHDRAVARGEAAGAVKAAFPGITLSRAVAWVKEVDDPVEFRAVPPDPE